MHSSGKLERAVMDDEEVVVPDKKEEIEKKCEPHCAHLYVVYQDCAERIAGRDDAHCTGQYLDYMKCIDHCVRARTHARAALRGAQCRDHLLTSRSLLRAPARRWRTRFSRA